MIAVAIKNLKNNLSKYLNDVVSGKAVLITKHERIVAKVIPYNEELELQSLQERLAGSVEFYDRPTDPVGEDDWEALGETRA